MFPSMGSGNGILFYRSAFFGRNVPFDRPLDAALRVQGTEFFFTGVLFLGNVPFDRPLDAALRVQGTEFFFTGVFFLGGCSLRRSSGNGFVSCQGMLSHGGRVSGVQNCVAILQSSENPWMDFPRRHTPDWKGAGRVAVGNGAGAEPWKAGDAGHGRSD